MEKVGAKLQVERTGQERASITRSGPPLTKTFRPRN